MSDQNCAWSPFTQSFLQMLPGRMISAIKQILKRCENSLYDRFYNRFTDLKTENKGVSLLFWNCIEVTLLLPNVKRIQKTEGGVLCS